VVYPSPPQLEQLPEPPQDEQSILPLPLQLVQVSYKAPLPPQVEQVTSIVPEPPQDEQLWVFEQL